MRNLQGTQNAALPVGHAYDGMNTLYCPDGRIPGELAATLANGVDILISTGQRVELPQAPAFDFPSPNAA